MQKYRALVCAALASSFALSSSIACAQTLWLEPQGEQIVLRAGDVLSPEAKLPVLTDTKVAGEPVELATGTAEGAAPRIAEAGGGDIRFAATQEGSDGVLTYHHAKMGRADTKAGDDFELVPVEPQGNVYKLFFKGRPVAASQVNVETSEGWRRVLRPAEDGTVTLPTPFAGLYVMTVTARVNNGIVTIKDKKYTDVRHSAALSFTVR